MHQLHSTGRYTRQAAPVVNSHRSLVAGTKRSAAVAHIVRPTCDKWKCKTWTRREPSLTPTRRDTQGSQLMHAGSLPLGPTHYNTQGIDSDFQGNHHFQLHSLTRRAHTDMTSLLHNTEPTTLLRCVAWPTGDMVPYRLPEPMSRPMRHLDESLEGP